MVVTDDHPTRQRLTTVPESPCASPDTAPYCETDLNLAKSLNLKAHADVGSAQLDTVVSQHEIERAAVLEKEAMKCISRGEVREAVATFDAAVDKKNHQNRVKKNDSHANISQIRLKICLH